METIQEYKDAPETTGMDHQAAVARQYPRDIKQSIEKAIEIVTMSPESAQTCGYALLKEGKPIMGPTVHLARTIASCWGNIRTEARVVRITDTQVVSRGTCWDLETNVSAAFEISRSIIGKTGQRLSSDVITATGNAANSIAYRNAVFAIIPKAATDKVYQAAQNTITGDLSDPLKLEEKRKSVLKIFKGNYKISEKEVIDMCGREDINEIGSGDLALLLGLIQSLKDGDTTVSELIGPKKTKEEISAKKGKMKNKKVTPLP